MGSFLARQAGRSPSKSHIYVHRRVSNHFADIVSTMPAEEGLDAPSLLSLPEDMFIEIGSRLGDRDVAYMELACKRLYDAMLRPNSAWPRERRLDLNHVFPTSPPSPEVARLPLSIQAFEKIQ